MASRDRGEKTPSVEFLLAQFRRGFSLADEALMVFF
jgi:hypothetical protein